MKSFSKLNSKKMMKKITLSLLLLLVSMSATWQNATAQLPNRPQATLQGNITGNRVLSADTIYNIVGFVNIQPGASLRIPAGTLLVSAAGANGSIQSLRGDTVGGTPRPSGILVVEGTADRPVVLTSAQAFNGQGARQQIGGVVMNGLARNNVPGGTRFGEGGAGPGGGTNDADSSGSLRYMRVEYGGVVIAPGNEINGFTFNSVGSRTRLEYLQAHFIADDAFEWFGGTCNARYLVATGCDDDQLDTEFGVRGKIQFALTVNDPVLANRGYESNNDAGGTSAKPHNKYIAYNVTMIGSPRARASNENQDGIYLRANTGGLHYNHIIAFFGGAGVVIDNSFANVTGDNLTNDDASAASAARDSALLVKNSIFWVRSDTGSGTQAFGTPLFAIRRGAGAGAFRDTTGLGILYAPAARNVVVNPTFRGFPNLTTAATTTTVFTGTAPDFRPLAAEARSFATTPPRDGFFDPTANYVGAVDPSPTVRPWYWGWTNWTPNSTIDRGGSPASIRLDEARPVAQNFELEQNYPNPFNPSTTIRFSLPTSQVVTLKVYDMLGREVATLVNGERLGAGNYAYQFMANGLASGTYIYRLQAGSFVEAKKMTLVK